VQCANHRWFRTFAAASKERSAQRTRLLIRIEEGREDPNDVRHECCLTILLDKPRRRESLGSPKSLGTCCPRLLIVWVMIRNPSFHHGAILAPNIIGEDPALRHFDWITRS